jgi:type I restriction enzyme S subunit
MSKLLTQINNEKRTPLVLSDYIKIKHGFAFKGEDFSATPTPNVLVTPGNFSIGGGFKADKFKYYKGRVPEDYVLKENDLVVTMTDLSVDADTLGYSALIPNDAKKRFLHNQRIGLVQERKKGIDFGYLYYLMRTRPYQKYVVSTASGSTVKHTSPDRIAGYEYEFPSRHAL